MIRLAILASGSGSNAENITKYFSKSKEIEVAAIISNKADAYVLERAKYLKVPSYVFSRSEFLETDKVMSLFDELKIDWIILAGFLVLLPPAIVDKYEGRILNIHPSLLPKYGGKGMYGERVHKAVLENKEKYSGITLHLVDEEMDHGKILFQSSFALSDDETLESLEAKIHIREQADYPRIAEAYLNTL